MEHGSSEGSLLDRTLWAGLSDQTWLGRGPVHHLPAAEDEQPLVRRRSL